MPFAPTTTPAVRLPRLAGALFAPFALFALCAIALTGCGDEAGSTPDPVVDAGADADAPCPLGTIGCDCDDGACAEGRCADGVCVACPEGALRCPCGPGDACDDALVCEQGLCAEPSCPPGALDCPCGEGDACDTGLSCMDSTCLPVPECPPGVLDCPCGDDAGDTCDAPLVCINDVCRDCPLDTVDCPCPEGTCEGGLVCDTGACREAIGCVDAGCGPFQQCQAAADGVDARCLEACDEGYDYNAAEGRCVEQPPTCTPGAPTSIADECAAQNRRCTEGADGAVCGACLPGHLAEGDACVVDARANCTPDDEHSIADDCAAEQRECVPGADGATCGACVDDLVEDPSTGTCRPLAAFDDCDVEADCPEGLVCSTRAPAGNGRCLPPACGEGETFDLATGACTARCGCQGVGMTGRPWPVTDWNGDCICETEPGFFLNTAAGSRRAEACDADADGWTRRSAFSHIESPDEAVRLNARCPLRTIDRVALVNDAGQTLELTVATLSGGTALVEPLYETDESDDEAEAAERQSAAYGQRRLHAAELNPLTKACVTPLDDFNDNGISDLREHHRDAPGVRREWMSTFVTAAYFVELATGHYEAPAAGQAHGRYVITERRRCDAGTPEGMAVGYAPEDGPYAASCWRRRDAGYDVGAPLGYDFARWSCPEPDGACGRQAPPAISSIGTLPPHGVCDDLEPDVIGAWRGMGHASQFKCVEIIDEQAPRVEPYQRRRAEVRRTADGPGRYTLNACALSTCAADDPACVEYVFADDEPTNPGQPAMTCVADPEALFADGAPVAGRVGFAAINFQNYDRTAAYAGGCIDEQTEWAEICPGFDPAAPGAAVGVGNPRNFGKLICGCGLNYGGADCDLGCPDDQLHFGGDAPIDQPGCVDGYCIATPDPDGVDGGRSGFWMCGGFTASAHAAPEPTLGHAFHAEGALAPDLASGTITVRGHIPTFGTDGTPMCAELDEDGNCQGITLR